ncbi:MAG: hypothetical protein E7395_01995 [Ruminococcaceae bacterium]|nr:hypothetical protein [Oscillospiraceae bacterium]
MQKNKTLTRILALLALVAFIAVSVFSVFPITNAGATSIEQAQKKQKEATQKKDAAKEWQSKEIAKREEIDKQISAVQAEIDSYQQQIDSKNDAIAKSEIKIAELSREMQKQNEDYNDRAKRLIKKGNVSYTEILLRSKSIDDMLTRMSVVKRVAQYDSQKLEEIEQSMVDVAEMKVDLLDQKEEVLKLKEVQDEKKAELDGYRAESQAIIDDLQKDIDKYEREFQLAKQAEAAAKEEAERLRKQSDASGDVNVPKNFTGGKFAWPSNNSHRVTSPYGYRIHPVTGKSRFHAGIDIGAAHGTDILASADGVVIVSGYNSGGYGNYVVINHGGGYTTLYAHCSSLLVSRGQAVKKGQVIAKCGSTGMSTGPHIHYEVQVNGSTTNPMQYFN